MDVFFMAVYDSRLQGTKFYLCHGENTERGYHTDTLPILWLSDVVSMQPEASSLIVELWFSEYAYHLPFEDESGKHFMAPVRRVFELLAQLKRIAAASPTASRPLGTVRRTGEDSWVMYGAGGAGGGGAVVAGVDLGNGQMAFDIETLGVPYGGGGGGGAAQYGTELHQHLAGEGEWGSLSRPRSQSRRQRTQRHIVERNIELPLRSELPVQVRFHGGRREDCTIEHYNEMVDTGVWTGMGRIE